MDIRNAAIGALALVVLVLAVLLGQELRTPEDRAPDPVPAEIDRVPVAAIDVAVDREDLRSVEILFDRPLGDGRVGDVLERDPASLVPRVSGRWAWAAANVLRFTASGRLTPAMRYELELHPGLLVAEGQTYTGERRFEFQTDAFQVERVDVHEESAPDGVGRVVLRGEVRFNYAVEPEDLAPRLVLVDPEQPDDRIPVELETTYATTAVGWRSAPVRKGLTERVLHLSVRGDLTSHSGNVPLPADYTRSIALGSREVLVVRAVAGHPGSRESTLEVTLSSGVDPVTAAAHVSVTPAVEYRLASDRNVLRLRGAFRPGGRYELELSAGLRAEDGAALAQTHRETLTLADLPESVAFVGDGMFLSAQGARRIAIDTVNVDALTLTIDRVYRNNILYLVQQREHQVFSGSGWGEVSRVFGDRIAEKKLVVSGARNEPVRTTLELDAYVKGEEPGFYRVAVGRPGTWRTEQRWLLVSDLGIVAKRGRGDLLAWVSSFDDLRPKAGVKVRVISDQNQPVAEGRTDARGLLHLKGLEERFEAHPPAYVIAERGDDWSLLVLDRTRIETAGLDVGGAPAATAGYEAFLYGERDLYRPGETARGLAVLRDRSLEVPPPMPLVLRHRDPAGQERGRRRLTLGSAGLVEFEHEISEIARTGRHSLELLVGDVVVGSWRFQVEEFVPDRIRVSVIPPGEAVPTSPGNPLRYAVESAYLFGSPAAGLAVETEVRLEAAEFEPPGHPGFSFANPDRKFSGRRLLVREGVLDASGRSEFETEMPQGLEVPSSLAAVVTARVQEQGGRGVAARLRLPVHPYPRYVGLRRIGKGHPEPGTTVGFDWVSVAPDGSEAQAGALRAELFRDEWQTVLRRTPAGTWRYESALDARLVETQALATGATGRFEFTPAEYGRYRVVVTDRDSGASARVQFYASGWGFAPWAVENPGRVELDLEKEDYAPGERAVIQVRAPFSGRLLLTVERDGVLHTEVHDLAENTARVELLVRATWRPNVYVTATLVRAADALEPGAVGRAFGATPLYVDRIAHRLAVAIEAPEEVRPRGPLTLRVRTAPRGRVTIAAVDEGVLQLVAQDTPDPFEHFYRKRALGVSAHDIFAFLMPELEAGSAVGGGRDAARSQFLRTEGIRRVVPVAFWSGVLEADGRGVATASFEVPEFQGALRVMAVAHEGSNFGAASLPVRVRDPLVLLPTFPRFLSTHERVEIPVTLRNDTGAPGTFAVQLDVTGPVSLSGDARRTVDIEEGTEQTVVFALETAETLGEVVLELHAEGRGEVARARTILGLRPDLPAKTLEAAGSLEGDSLVLAADGAGALRSEGLQRQLRLASTPLVTLYGKLRDLLDYPYGCLEQTVSRAFPLVYVGDLARELEPALFEEHDPDGLVAVAIDRIASMQLADGGFSLWPRGRDAIPWVSVYAAHFLAEAARAGHAAEPTLGRALAWVAREAVAKERMSGPELERAVYALYVLARAGRAERASMDFVRERHADRLTSASRVLLGAAFAAAGDPVLLDELARRVTDAEIVRRQTGGNFSSTVRDRALLLLALQDAAPEDARIPGLASQLGRDALGRRWNTQETSIALLALGQLHGAAADADYTGAVFVEGNEIARFDSETTILRDLPRQGALEIRLDPGGTGRPYYSLWVRGTPTDAAFSPEAEGLEIERTFLDRDGKPLAEASVAQGDLVVARIRVRSTAGRVENLVVQNWLPAGFEVENPRLETSEQREWADANLPIAYVDVRDDRVLLFAELPDAAWRTGYALLRAVIPGRFRLPPVQVEAMYEPGLRATGPRGSFEVRRRP